jgi:hypothetical protein
MHGIDGVLVLGCHLGDCHYISGNYEAEIKMKMLSTMLGLSGFADRLRLDWVSAAEGNRFAQFVSEFTEKIQKLGPSPLKDKKKKDELLINLNAINNALCDQRLRALVARQRIITTEGNVYGNLVDEEKFEEIINEAIEKEFIRHKIVEKIKEKGMSVPDIAKEIEVEPHIVLRHIVTLRARGLVDVDQINEEIPTFISIGK